MQTAIITKYQGPKGDKPWRVVASVPTDLRQFGVDATEAIDMADAHAKAAQGMIALLGLPRDVRWFGARVDGMGNKRAWVRAEGNAFASESF